MIKITSDSTCDLSPELLAKYDIELLPLSIIKGGAPFRDGIELTPADIFRHVDSGGAITTTSAVSVGEYHACFARLSPRYEAVIHINIGAGFSSCHQNARIAAEEFENVYVVDSENLCGGQGHVVVEAARAAESGMAPQDIAAYLRGLTPRLESSFILNQLDYLVKGGRCSTAAMLGANLLKLKPCIEVADGKMSVAKKYRGSFEKCVLEYVRERLKGRHDLERERLFIAYTTWEDSLLEAVQREATKYLPFKQIFFLRAGCTISSHCGPNTVGLFYIRNQ